MSEDDARYFQRRAEEERRCAAEATDPCTKHAHQRIANEYGRIARDENPIELRMVPQ